MLHTGTYKTTPGGLVLLGDARVSVPEIGDNFEISVDIEMLYDGTGGLCVMEINPGTPKIKIGLMSIGSQIRAFGQVGNRGGAKVSTGRNVFRVAIGGDRVWMFVDGELLYFGKADISGSAMPATTVYVSRTTDTSRGGSTVVAYSPEDLGNPTLDQTLIGTGNLPSTWTGTAASTKQMTLITDNDAHGRFRDFKVQSAVAVGDSLVTATAHERQLVGTVPAGSIGTANVEIFGPWGTESAGNFTYTSPDGLDVSDNLEFIGDKVLR
jgi:hypothetical protein